MFSNDAIASFLYASLNVTIPAQVRELSDKQASAIMLLENVARENLPPIAEAQAYQTRLTDPLESIKGLAESIGVSCKHINERLRLLELDSSIQPLVTGKTGGLPIGHGLAMSKLSSKAQIMVLRLYLKNDKKAVALTHFAQLCNEIYEKEAQLDMFSALDESFWGNELTLISEAQVVGKGVKLRFETSEILPKVQATSKQNTGQVIADHIDRLADSGFESEAIAIATMFESLVNLNYLKAPQSALPAKATL